MLIASNALKNYVNNFFVFAPVLSPLGEGVWLRWYELQPCQSPHSHTYRTPKATVSTKPPHTGDKPRVSVLHSDNNANSFTSSSHLSSRTHINTQGWGDRTRAGGRGIKRPREEKREREEGQRESQKGG